MIYCVLKYFFIGAIPFTFINLFGIKFSPNVHVELVSEIFISGVLLVGYEIFKRRHVLQYVHLNRGRGLKASLISLKSKRFRRVIGLFEEERLEFEGALISLHTSGRITENSYTDQMTFARFFYLSHRQRFWATSLDRWLFFFKSNEDYLAAMPISQENISRIPTFSENGVPDRSRVFVQKWTDFIHDLAIDEIGSALLVSAHIKAWGICRNQDEINSSRTGIPPIRIVLRQDASFLESNDEQTFTHELEALLNKHSDNLELPIIPDVMIVDNDFIYGRVSPKEIKTDLPFGPGGVVLERNGEKQVVQAYCSMYQDLWKDSIDLRDLYESLFQTQNSDSSVTTDYATALTELAGNDDIPTPSRDILDNQFRNTLRRIHHMVEDSCNEDERFRIYGEIAQDLGLNLVQSFAEAFIQRQSGEIIALDMADIKVHGKRFWESWTTLADYKTFDEATLSTDADFVRRIYVVRSLDGLSSENAVDFLLKRLEMERFGIGLITKDNLERLTTNQNVVSTSTLQSPASFFDSDFIICGLKKEGSELKLDESCGGFELGPDSFSNAENHRTGINRTNHLSPKNNLLLPRRMMHLASQFQFVYGSQFCHKFETAQELKGFLSSIQEGV